MEKLKICDRFTRRSNVRLKDYLTYFIVLSPAPVEVDVSIFPPLHAGYFFLLLLSSVDFFKKFFQEYLEPFGSRYKNKSALAEH